MKISYRSSKMGSNNNWVKTKFSRKPNFFEKSRPTKKTRNDQSMEIPKVPGKPSLREIEETCRNGNFEKIKEIAKKHGIHLLFSDPTFTAHRTMLGIAARHDKIDIMKYLMDNGAYIEGFEVQQACINANLKVIKEIVTKFGVDKLYYHETFKEKFTLLEIAAKNCKITIMKFLIDYGANIEGPDPNYTILDRIIFSRGHESVVKLLIESGANINYKSRWGDRIIHQVVDSSTFSIVKILVDNGVDLNAKNKRGETPLMLAIKKRRYDIVDLIEKKLEEQSTPSQNARENLFEQSMMVPKKQIELDDCMVCFNRINVPCAFNPCGHAKACEDCCLKITNAANPTCPLCRSTVDNYLKIFF